MQGKEYSPPEISAMVLQKLKQQAERYLGQPVTQAVITVPAYFNDSQRQATKDAGKIAGLEVKRIINEPTAAALAYGLNKKKDEVIAVYDFGGGTFDISILEVGDDVVEVKATNGDTHLGGDDIDDVIIKWLIASSRRRTASTCRARPSWSSASRTPPRRPRSSSRPRRAPRSTCRSSPPTRRAPSTSRSRCPGRLRADDRPDRGADPRARPRRAQGLGPRRRAEIDEVILVGGSTRIPLVQKRVQELFGKEPNRSVNPDEVVAVGAAIQAGVLDGDVTSMLLLDVTPLSLGIETLGGVNTVMIPRNTTIPHSKTEVFSTAADNQTAVDVYVFQGERQMARDNKLARQLPVSPTSRPHRAACRRSRSPSTSMPTVSCPCPRRTRRPAASRRSPSRRAPD